MGTAQLRGGVLRRRGQYLVLRKGGDMLLDIGQMERVILETAYEEGTLNLVDGFPTPGARVLVEKFPSEDERQALTVTSTVPA